MCMCVCMCVCVCVCACARVCACVCVCSSSSRLSVWALRVHSWTGEANERHRRKTHIYGQRQNNYCYELMYVIVYVAMYICDYYFYNTN